MGPPGRESALLGGEMSPSGRPNQPEGLREGRFAALLPRTFVPGELMARLFRHRRQILGPDSHANAGEPRSASESRKRVHSIIVPFFSKCTDRDSSEGWSAEGSERARCDRALGS